MTGPLVSVLVVNYNSGGYLARCLKALEAQTFADFEVVLVDNGSTDGSLERALSSAAGLASRLKTDRAGGNIGFAAANNRAARSASGQWVATLNPDAFADPDWLAQLMAATARHADAAMFGSTQRAAEQPGMLDGTGDAYHVLGIAWRGNFGHSVAELPPEGEVFGPCAAAALYRRDAFDAAGGFDESFFCYHEDVDLAFRLRLAGHHCIQVAAAAVDHVGSAITGRTSEFSIYHGTRNRIWTFVKNMPSALFWPVLPVTAAAHLYLLLRAASVGRFGVTWRGMRDAICGLGPVWRERRRLQNSRHANLADIARAMTWQIGKLRRRAHDVRPT
jgi:N-acetylglucosaminyl-diphospho-decaprenol L-rhamnosyltransferase